MDEMKFTYTSTQKDLIDMYEADRALKPFISGFLILMGLFLMSIFVLSFFIHSLEGNIRYVGLVIGSVMLWCNIFAPYFDRRRIRKVFFEKMNLEVVFNKEGVMVNSDQAEPIERKWDELMGYRCASMGLMMLFADETMAMIPSRAFDEVNTMDVVVKLIEDSRS